MLCVKEKDTSAGMGGSEQKGQVDTPPPHTHTSWIIVMEVVVAEVDDIRELPFLIFNRP